MIRSLLLFLPLITIVLSIDPCYDLLNNDLIRWSQWGSNFLNGDNITIDEDMKVLLDVSPGIRFDLVMIKGVLVFDRMTDIVFEANEVIVYGRLIVGEDDLRCRVEGEVTITLYGQQEREGDTLFLGVGKKCIACVDGCVLDFHGAYRFVTWTQLDGSVGRGENQINVVDSVDWKIGEKIIIVTTDYEDFEGISDPNRQPTQTEERVITQVSSDGKTIGFDEPLDYMHWGEIWSQNGDDIDMRGEVALITRNILIKGDISGTAEDDGWGAHMIITSGGTAHIEGIEIIRSGQKGELGRYPIHFHVGGEQATSYVKKNSIHDCFQRCLTVHGTHNLLVKDNIGYNTFGHMFFIEDGNEMGNIFDHNLGVMARPHDDLLVADEEPAIFWTVNPTNHYYDNVAVGGAFGFWYSIPESPFNSGVPNPSNQWEYLLRYYSTGDFIRNKAHSNRFGLFFDQGQADPEGNIELASFTPRDFSPFISYLPQPNDLLALEEWQRDSFGNPVPSLFVDFTAYKCADNGMWGRGTVFVSIGAKLADNGVGCTWPAQANYMIDTVFVGETDNVGDQTCTSCPVWWNWWGDEGGRTRPFPYWKTKPLIGYSSYDAGGGDMIFNSRFYNYNDFSFSDILNYTEDQNVRRSGAFSGIMGPNVISPLNRYYNNEFINVDNPVYWYKWLPYYDEVLEKILFRDTALVDDAMQGVVLVDADGTITSECGSSIVGSSPILRFDGCTEMPDWNAWHCPPYYAHRTISFRDIDNIIADGFIDDEAAREATDGVLTRLSDGSQVYIQANLEEYFGYIQAELIYNTNLVVNQDYMISNRAGTIPANFEVHFFGWVGEFIRVAIPYPNGTTFTVMQGFGETPVNEVFTMDDLDLGTFFYDTTENLLWLYLKATDEEWNWAVDQAIRGDNYLVRIYADCGGRCTQIAPTVSGPQPSGFMTDLCEIGVGPTGGLLTYTQLSDSKLSVFQENSWESGWAEYIPDGETSVCAETMTSSEIAEGNVGLKCTLFNLITYRAFYLYSTSPQSFGAYTHLQFKARAAPDQGIVNIIVGLVDGGAIVNTNNPAFTHDGLPVDESKWTTVTIPISYWGLTSVDTFDLLFIGINQVKPGTFFLDDIALVSLTESVVDYPEFPRIPEFDTSPKSGYAQFHINEQKRIPGVDQYNTGTEPIETEQNSLGEIDNSVMILQVTLTIMFFLL